MKRQEFAVWPRAFLQKHLRRTLLSGVLQSDLHAIPWLMSDDFEVVIIIRLDGLPIQMGEGITHFDSSLICRARKIDSGVAIRG